MKKISATMFIIILICMSAGVAGAADRSGSASVDFMSNYVWRGQKLSNAAVIQPSVGIMYEGFGVNLWTNYDTGTNEHNETDLTVDYSFAVDKMSVDAGYIFYALDGADDTQEVYVTVGYDILLSPSLTIYYDFDEGEGAFIVAAIGHSFSLAGNMNLDLSASASYNGKNLVMGADADGDKFSNFYNGNISASVSVPVAGAISITPVIAYTFPLSNDAETAIESASDDGDSNLFYGGINLTISF
jgi:hypothetical protein